MKNFPLSSTWIIRRISREIQLQLDLIADRSAIVICSTCFLVVFLRSSLHSANDSHRSSFSKRERMAVETQCEKIENYRLFTFHPRIRIRLNGFHENVERGKQDLIRHFEDSFISANDFSYDPKYSTTLAPKIKFLLLLSRFSVSAQTEYQFTYFSHWVITSQNWMFLSDTGFGRASSKRPCYIQFRKRQWKHLV